MDNIDYNSTLKTRSIDLIKRDGELLVDLMNIHNNTINLALIPFCALYCRSAKEFLGVDITETEEEKRVKDIRNAIKIFTGKYSNGVNMALNSDGQQDEIFKNKLRFSFLKNHNIYYNLGVYFNEAGKVVYNTQLANFFLNIRKDEKQSDEENALKIGENLGGEIVDILVRYYGIGVADIMRQTTSFDSVPKCGYIDFNTNKRGVFFNKELSKEINLVLLHMLSMIGFVNNLLIPIFQEINLWLLRIVYITVHNTLLGIKKIKQHYEQSVQSSIVIHDFNEYIIKNTYLLSSPFRNCMMHYDFIDINGHPVILKDWYNPNRPFFGLIESCYEGMNFNQFYDNLFKLSQELEKYLLDYFTVNEYKIHWNL